MTTKYDPKTNKQLVEIISKIVMSRPLTNKVTIQEIAEKSNLNYRTIQNYGDVDNILTQEFLSIKAKAEEIHNLYHRFGDKCLLLHMFSLISDEKAFYGMALREHTDRPFQDLYRIIFSHHIPENITPEEIFQTVYWPINALVYELIIWKNEKFIQATKEKHIDNYLWTLGRLRSIGLIK